MNRVEIHHQIVRIIEKNPSLVGIDKSKVIGSIVSPKLKGEKETGDLIIVHKRRKWIEITIIELSTSFRRKECVERQKIKYSIYQFVSATDGALKRLSVLLKRDLVRLKKENGMKIKGMIIWYPLSCLPLSEARERPIIKEIAEIAI